MAKKILNTDVDILGLLNLPLLNNEAPLHVLTLNNDDDVVIRTLPEILSDIGVTGNYQLLSEKGQANGYAPLDSTGEIPSQYLPDIDTTETDPIFTASPARSITNTNINNWDEAFFWGDHALAGYVPETRTLSNGPGINPIGNLSLSRTISLDFDYLDGRYASGLLQREAALVASEDNITLSGLQTIDGIALSEGDRVLLLGQTNPTENGVYLASAGTWTRATDFDQPNFEEVSQGASIFVTSGVDLGGTGWTLQTENPITIGTTPLVFIQYAGTSNYVAGNLIDIVGNSINHEAGSWSNKSNLTGATVISNLSVDAYGHPTNWTTRTLTPSSIGAEPSFAKNNAFNKNFGTSAGTVAQGNDSRINNGQTAYSWGNHASAGYALMDNLNANNGQLTIVSNNDYNKGLRLMNQGNAQSSYLFMDSSEHLNINNATNSSRTVWINKGGTGNLSVGGRIISGGSVSGTAFENTASFQNANDILNLPSNSITGNTNTLGSSNFPFDYGSSIVYNGNTTNRTFMLSRNNNTNQFWLSDYSSSGWRHQQIYHTNNLNPVETSRQINTGLHLSGGGNLSTNRTLTVTPTVNNWIVDSQGNQRMYFYSNNNGGILLRASAAGGKLAYRDQNNNDRFSVDTNGNANFSGTVTGSNLSGTNTGDQTLSGLGGVPTTRTITAGSGLTGGGNLSSNRTLSVDSTVARTNTSETFSSTVTATNFILSSDRRLKENIESLGNGYYTFNFKDDKTKRKRYGAMADEVKEYAPELIYINEEGYEQVGYIDFLIKKIAELENKINSL